MRNIKIQTDYQEFCFSPNKIFVEPLRSLVNGGVIFLCMLPAPPFGDHENLLKSIISYKLTNSSYSKSICLLMVSILRLLLYF